MKTIKSFFVLFFALSSIALAQRSFLSYYELSDFQMAAPGAYKFGLYGFDNPAMTSYLHDADMMIVASEKQSELKNFDRWGIFSGNSHSGSAILMIKDGSYSIKDYRLSLSFGSRVFSLGLGYGFIGGDKSHFGRSNIFKWGGLIRPNKYFSLGFHQTYSLDFPETESVVDFGVRPFANYPLTLFVDGSIFNDQKISDAGWSAGASWECIDGIRLNGRYFKDKSLIAGIELSFGKFGIGSISSFNTEQKYDFNSYMIRFGAIDRTIFDFEEASKYLKLDLGGSIKYQKIAFFDKSNTLFKVLKSIDIAKKSEKIKGIVINTSGISNNIEMLYEIREKLKDFKQSGKQVYIFIDRLGIQGYYFASIADKIIMDPIGNIVFEGFIMGRSFYKNLLSKIDIGFEELRYFKYKSAVENFSREKMSDADREQRQEIVDGWYEHTKEEISKSRHLSFAEFDDILNNKIFLNPKLALEKGLIDKIGRWSYVEKIMNEYDSKFKNDFVSIKELIEEPKPFDNKWSEPKKNIAIIYAIGDCAMDGGIKARKLVEDLKFAAENSNINAIVLRVDSPGGDGMASDYIAQVVREYKSKKPIIVSQGMLAASGGYWLSMDATKIVSTPVTITASIGVISSWIYDKGMKDSLGISIDFVKKGKYADLGYSWGLPLIGLGLPVRNLSDDEKSQFEQSIKSHYQEFVQMVADGRKMNFDNVEKIAQGRVYLGEKAKNLGLVDEIGGLDFAIELAKKEAGILTDEDVEFIELPKTPFLSFAALITSIFGVEAKDVISPELEHFIFRVKNNGIPMPIMELDYYDFIYGN